MKRIIIILNFILVYFLFIGSHGLASDKKLPLIDGKLTVATVNDEPITLEEFNSTIAVSHATRSEKKKAGQIDYSAIMNRMINTRLIVIEARNMEIDKLPEIRNTLSKYSKEALMKVLIEEHVKDIKADEDEVERLYKKMVKEWKITSVRFEKEADAKNMEKDIKAGKNFEEIVKKAVNEGTAKEVDEGVYLKDKDLTPRIAQLVVKMEIGSASPIVSVGEKGFAILRLEGVRFPEDVDLEARERAKRQVLDQKRVQAAKDYYQDLRKQYVKVDEEIFTSLDYESKEPGFEKLLKDKRVIAEISGEKPVTVGELTKALKQKFYHGVERAITSASINKRKRVVLEEILRDRVWLKEAFKQNIDKMEIYKNRIKEYEKALIFGTFIEKVIIPGIKLDVKELKTYYKENSDEYTFPEMMRIRSLVFANRSDAVNTLDKLIKGTDFTWLSSNAEGQVDKNSQGLLQFKGELLTVRSFPEGVQKALAGANPGDFRLYASAEGYFYVLHIYHVMPATPKPFEDVKKEIAKEVFNEKVKKAVEAYADKLKEYYPVKIYAKDLQ